MRWLAVLALAVSGCTLPAEVLYRCEVDGGCALEGTSCGDDGFCHALDGGCLPRARALACAGLACGFVSDGCGGALSCGDLCAAPLHCEANHCARPSLCTDEGWCWEHPLPQGAALHAAFSADARHTWFAGAAHTLLFFDGAAFSLQPVSAEPGADFLALHGASSAEVLAVGTRGLIAHFTGDRWQREGSVTPQPDTWTTVLDLGDGGAFVGSREGHVFRRTEGDDPFARWADDGFVDAGAIVSLAQLDATTLLLTAGGAVYARHDDGWMQRPSLPAAPRASVVRHGVLWVATADAVFTSAADGGWARVHDAGGDALVASAAGVLLLAGDALTRLEESGLARRAPLTRGWSAGVAWGDGLFAAGDDGALAVLDLDGGTRWRSTTPRDAGVLTAVCEAGDARVAVGGDGWLEWAGDAGWAWRQQPGARSQWLGCFASSARQWLTGSAGEVLVLAPAGAQVLDVGAQRLEAAWSDGANLWLTQASPQLLYAAEASPPFAPVEVSAPASLSALWGVGGELLAVGAQGTLTRFVDGGWSATQQGPQTFRAVHGVSSGGGALFVAVGDDGAAVRWGQTLQDVRVPAAAALTSVWVHPSGAAWVTGADGDGAAKLWRSTSDGGWAEVPLTLPLVPRGLTGAPALDGGASLVLVGEHDFILRRP